MEVCITEYTSKDISKPEGEINPDAEKYMRFFPIDESTYTIYMNGFVGAINLTNQCALYSYPKVGISNVLKMFDYSKRKFKTEDYTLEFQEDINFLDLLSRIFIQEAEKICRTAYRRYYAPKIENLLSIKGKILVSETLQRNLAQPHVLCEYQDFTDDIIENRILKYVIYLQLKAFSGNPQKKFLFHKLRNLYSFFNNVKLQMISSTDIQGIHYNRLNNQYEKAHYISRFFIEYLYISHSFGGKSFYSFMIDMEKLFEDFVRNIIKIFNTKYVTSTGRNYLDITRSLIRLKPDIVMKDNRVTKLILDCKYKKIKKIPEDRGIDIAKPYPSDVYQMLSYLVAYKCPHGVLIYPKGECEDAEIPIEVEQKKYTIHVKQIDLMKINVQYLHDFAWDLDKYIIT